MRQLFVVLVMFVWSFNAFAQIANYNINSDLQEMIPKLLELSESGDVEAQSFLGETYLYGFGCDIDGDKAFFWLSKAAEAGNSSAIHHLSVCYRDGLGVRKDPIKAFMLAEKAAKLGNIRALMTLGGYYIQGVGTTIDYKKGYQCFQKIYDEGDVLGGGSCMLGILYEHGLGVKKNVPKAMSLFKESADKGNNSGIENYNRLYRKGYREKKSKKNETDYEPYN